MTASSAVHSPVSAAVSAPAPWIRSVHLLVLGCFTLAMRLIAPSAPYFVDGPAHVRAVSSGRLIIQPPGYFLFNFTAYALAKVTHLAPALSLNVLNISFSVLAVLVFYLLASHWFRALDALSISLVYATSPLVWFAADVQSTYAAMTLFVPLLILVLRVRGQFVAGCLVWAVLAGFRPSDGVFLLPWMVWEARLQPWSVRIRGAVAGGLGMLVWWVPTAQRFGGGFMGPIEASRSQASGLAQGAVSHPLSTHSLNNVLRTCSGMVIAWGIMLPLVIAGAMFLSRENGAARSWLIAIAPGVAFFIFYYMADATYLSFCVAPGLLIAGLFLQGLKQGPRAGVYSLAIAASILFMVTARPIAPTTGPRALFDAYGAKYSIWSLRHQYAPRLASLLGQCGQNEVMGTCADGSPPGADR